MNTNGEAQRSSVVPGFKREPPVEGDDQRHCIGRARDRLQGSSTPKSASKTHARAYRLVMTLGAELRPRTPRTRLRTPRTGAGPGGTQASALVLLHPAKEPPPPRAPYKAIARPRMLGEEPRGARQHAHLPARHRFTMAPHRHEPRPFRDLVPALVERGELYREPPEPRRKARDAHRAQRARPPIRREGPERGMGDRCVLQS